ncbi:MAG TPA: hypothetical protein VFA39_15835 [Steroidobacteraceae bacterium]|nr:hypothetical protein [Steroidobacteraceae bacterium]
MNEPNVSTTHMPRTVEVRREYEYGRVRMYPVNKAAQVFADINGKQTLSRETLQNAIELGFDVSVLNAESSDEAVHAFLNPPARRGRKTKTAQGAGSKLARSTPKQN